MDTFNDYIELPTAWGTFYAYCLNDERSSHLMLRFGDLDPAKPLLVRIHSSCCFGDVFHGLLCDCREQLHASIEIITAERRGLVFYLNQEGRGVGLAGKIEAIRLEQRHGLDTVEAFHHLKYPLDQRGYALVAETLRRMGVRTVRLLTNNPRKIAALRDGGIEVIREQLITAPSAHALKYIETKIEKMGHLNPASFIFEKNE